MRTLATIVIALLSTMAHAQEQRYVYVDPTASYGAGEDTIARFVGALQEHPMCENVDQSVPCPCRTVIPQGSVAGGADYTVWFESTGDRSAAIVWVGHGRGKQLLVGITDTGDAEAVAKSVCEMIEQ